MLADLVVGSVSAPLSAQVGVPLTVDDAADNRGAADAESFRVGIYLSADATITTGDVLIGSRTVPDLAEGGTDGGTTTVTIPLSVTTGTYYVGAMADDLGECEELDESNNGLASSTPTSVASDDVDLLMTVVSAPANARAGDTITVSNTVRNLGTDPAGSFRVGIYLSVDSDIAASDTLIGSRTVSSLLGGGSHIDSTSATIPAATPLGTYYIGAIADDQEAVGETDEANNALASASTFDVGVIDLVMTVLSGPGSANAGDNVALINTVRNAGGADAGAFRVTFYLSTNDTITDQDTLLGSRQIAGLPALLGDTDTTTVTVPPGTQDGTYYIGAVVDDLGQVDEFQEGNNVFVSATPIDIGATPGWDAYEPDGEPALAATAAVDGPAQSHNFHNGNDRDWLVIDISGPTTIVVETFFLSGCDTYLVLYAADGSTVLAEDDNSGSDSWDASRIAWSFAGPATCYVEVKPAWVPGSTGDYVVSVTTFSSGIDVDLLAENANLWSRQVLAGNTVSLSYGVRNAGTTDCAPFRVGVYLSADATITTLDTLLFSEVIPGLGGGANRWYDSVLTIPAATGGGDYWVGVIADDLFQVAETDESNNAAASPDPLGVGPDVAVTFVSCPAGANEGEMISIDNVVRNAGLCSLYDIEVVFLLSPDTDIDLDTDRWLNSRWISGPLAPGAGDTATTSVMLPIPMDSGTWYIGVYAYLQDMMMGDPCPETDLTNNVMVSAIIIAGTGGPDLVMRSVSVSPLAVRPGDSVSSDNTVENVGSATTGVASEVGFYLATYPQMFWMSWLLGSRAVPILGGGLSDSETTALTVPLSAPGGNFYFVARADGGSVVTELDEENNVLAAAGFISIDGPDMDEPQNDTQPGAGFLDPLVEYPNPYTFHASGDVDWFVFSPMMPGMHTIETSNLTLGADTVIELYRPGEETPMLTDDDGGAEPGASKVTFNVTSPTQWYVRVTHAAGGTGHYSIRCWVAQ